MQEALSFYWGKVIHKIELTHMQSNNAEFFGKWVKPVEPRQSLWPTLSHADVPSQVQIKIPVIANWFDDGSDW